MRKAMVTRAFKATKIIALVANTTNCELMNEEFTLPKTYNDGKKLEKACRAKVDTDEVKFVSIVSKEEVETLYGMDVQFFIDHSKVLDNETRKEIVDIDEEDEDEE